MPLLGNPVLAAFLGAAVGVGSFLLARAASRLVTPQDPFLGFAKVALVSLGRMLAIIVALAACFAFARPGFPAFAFALIVSFMGTLGFEAFRASSRTHRPARTG
jgi:hypothetical protein